MLERVRLNDESRLKKQCRPEKKQPRNSNNSTEKTSGLPPELNLNLDRRTSIGKITYHRLIEYVSQITTGGKRALRPAEVANLKTIILLERQLDEQFSPHHRRLDAEDLKGLSSELRRQLGALGLDAAAPESAPSPPPSQEPAASGDDGFLKTFLDGVEALSQAIRNEKEQAVTPAREKSRRRKPRRVRRQHRPAPKTTVDDDEEIKSGVRRNGAWFPSDM